MIYFTSDIHFGHKNIIQYSKRPFKDVTEMNETIISNWNATVGRNDDIYIDGDFAFLRPDETMAILRRLNGNKFLVKGNHDKLDSAEVKQQFVWVRDYHELNVDLGEPHKQKIVLCHYAMRVWNKSHHGSWNVYGHSHGSLPPVGKQIDVGVDAVQHYHSWYGDNFGAKPFYPISLAQLKLMMDTVEFNPVDHHGE